MSCAGESLAGTQCGLAHVKPIFRSFLQAGFECSTHKLRTGKRLDLVSSTRHDTLVSADYERLRRFGIATVREGVRWHLIEAQPGIYDFSSARRILEAAHLKNIEIVWDLVHFGWPDHLDIFDRSWVYAFGEFAFRFGKLLRREGHGTIYIAPINEISFMSWAGGDTAYLNPFATNRGPELKRQLVRGYLRAAQGLRAELPGVRLVSPEPVIHIVGRPECPDDVREPAEYRSSMFEAWDMITGRSQPELGGAEHFLDVIGVNYYDRNQWWNHGPTVKCHDPEYRPFRDILTEVYERYKRPLFVAETGTEDAERPSWFAYIHGEVMAGKRAGVPLQGLCWYPILNHPGWDDERHCRNGLWDYVQADGSREIFEPLAQEILLKREATV